jgi:hypothetical protein
MWPRTHAMKILIMQFSHDSHYFIPPRSKYSPQHPGLSLNVIDQVLLPNKTVSLFPRSPHKYLLYSYVFYKNASLSSTSKMSMLLVNYKIKKSTSMNSNDSCEMWKLQGLSFLANCNTSLYNDNCSNATLINRHRNAIISSLDTVKYYNCTISRCE